MKKSVFIAVALAVAVSLSGCAASSPSAPSKPSGSKSSSAATPAASSLQYTVKDVVSPKTVDRSASYTTFELDALSKLGSVSGIYFLDDDNFIFSAKNGKVDDQNPDSEYDLYKYNLKTETLTRICEGVMLDVDDTVAVKDADNFSIIDNNSYYKIKNNRLVNTHDYTCTRYNEHFVCDAVYNEANGKLLFTETDQSGKITAAYVSDSDLSSPQQLPFSGIYRVQWADKSHVLVAFKEGDKSVLAKYGLDDKSVVLTELPYNNFFIDPVICDNGSIDFMYLETRDAAKPVGLLNTTDGTISRIYFEDCNPKSLVRNGQIAAFTDSGDEHKLFLYNTKDNTSMIRGTVHDYPFAVAVSPNGSTIAFASSDLTGKRTFYINTIK